MDKIRFDFDQARRQLRQIRNLRESTQDCLGQARQARTMMRDLGDGEVVRFLTDDLEARIRDGQRLCDRLDRLEAALRKNLQRFEALEERLTRNVEEISVKKDVIRPESVLPLISQAHCSIGESRFADLFYPDFLSEAADLFFASTL